LRAARSSRTSSSRRNCAGLAISTAPFSGEPSATPHIGAGQIHGRHGLDESRRQAYRITVGGKIGDAFDEFEKLRRAETTPASVVKSP
jgi:hypothetical protein